MHGDYNIEDFNTGAESTDPAWEEYLSTGIDPTGGELGPTFALSNGIPPDVVMKFTGHADYKSMKPYIDITESAKKDAIKKMEEAFKKKYSGIKADIRRIIIGEYLAFSPNIQ